jgi:hypothetical protein
MVSQELNESIAVHDKETALEEYDRRCQAVTLAENRLKHAMRHPNQETNSMEAALQSARAYAQEGWEVVVSYLR